MLETSESSYTWELFTVATADGWGKKENEAKWGQRGLAEKSNRSGESSP